MPTALFLYPGLHFLRMVNVFVSERQTRKGRLSLESSSGCSGPSRHIGPVMGTRTGIEQHTVNVKVSQMQEMPCSCQICKILHGRIILGHPVHAPAAPLPAALRWSESVLTIGVCGVTGVQCTLYIHRMCLVPEQGEGSYPGRCL